MTDVWIPRMLVAAQIVIIMVLGALVATGHDSSISDALLAVTGSLTGSSLLSAAKGKVKAKATK